MNRNLSSRHKLNKDLQMENIYTDLKTKNVLLAMTVQFTIRATTNVEVVLQHSLEQYSVSVGCWVYSSHKNICILTFTIAEVRKKTLPMEDHYTRIQNRNASTCFPV